MPQGVQKLRCWKGSAGRVREKDEMRKNAAITSQQQTIDLLDSGNAPPQEDQCIAAVQEVAFVLLGGGLVHANM